MTKFNVYVYFASGLIEGIEAKTKEDAINKASLMLNDSNDFNNETQILDYEALKVV